MLNSSISKLIFPNNIFKLKEEKSNNVKFPSFSSEDSFKNVHFTGLANSLKYVNSVSKYYENKGEKLSKLDQLDPERLDGILEGIEIFENFEIKDLYVLPGLIDVLMQRGCGNTCEHCFVAARPGHNITLPWEDVTNVTEGLGKIIKRLGFNPFDVEENRFKLSERMYSYIDGDPIEFKSRDKNGIFYNVAAIADKFNKETGSPFNFKTAGWNENNEFFQKAAEDIIDLMLNKNPNAIKLITVSLHPFHNLMTQANKALDLGNTEKAVAHKAEYVDRMANVLETFLPLAKKGKLEISGQYSAEAYKGSGYTYKDEIQLLNDAFDKVEERCAAKGIDCSFLTGQRDFTKNSNFEGSRDGTFVAARPIMPIGRTDIKKFGGKERVYTYVLDKSQGKRNILINGVPAADKFNMEISRNFIAAMKESSDFADNFIINIDPGNNIYLRLGNKLKSLNPQESQKFDQSFVNVMANTIQAFLPIFEMGKGKIRLAYSPDQGYSKEELTDTTKKILEKLKDNLEHKQIDTTKYENILSNKIEANDIFEFRETSEADHLKLFNSNPQNPFATIIKDSTPKNAMSFIKKMRKCINIDGSVLLLGFNKDRPFEGQYIRLTGIPNLKYTNTVVPIHDAELSTVKVDKSFITVPEEVKIRDEGLFGKTISFCGNIFKRQNQRAI